MDSTLDVKRAGGEDKASLLAKIKVAADQGESFALTKEEFFCENGR
jgi:hypothetical protein